MVANKLTAAQINELQAAGKAWGEMEVECWLDQHDGKTMAAAPEWTPWTFCGKTGYEETDAAVEAEEVIDNAARDAWNAAKDAAE